MASDSRRLRDILTSASDKGKTTGTLRSPSGLYGTLIPAGSLSVNCKKMLNSVKIELILDRSADINAVPG